MSVKEIKEWFDEAVPSPTDANKSVQIGCHFEEVAEMMTAMGINSDQMELIATKYKKRLLDTPEIDRKEVLDALCDQIVTAVGIAHMYGLNITDGIREVNRSNWSKFVNGKAVFDENGKIKKGPDYTPPDLTGMY